MSNPVQDQLAAVPPTPSWQPDAGTTDSNEPLNSDSAKVTTPTGLSPNLRSIKSNVRALSANLGWINYTGLQSAPSPYGLVKVNDGIFTIAGDWTAVNIPLNLPITAGQRVKFHFSDGSIAVGDLVTVAFGGTVTTFTMRGLPITGDLTATGYVEFGSAGTPYSNGSDPLVLIPASDTGDTYPTVPPIQGGTGHSVVSAEPTGDVVVGAGGFPTTKVVQFQENQPVADTMPSGGVGDQLLWWDNSGGGTWRVRSLADQVPDNSVDWLPFINTAIQFALTSAISGSLSIGGITIKWGTSAIINLISPNQEGATTITWSSAFTTNCYAVACCANQATGAAGTGYAMAQWQDAPGPAAIATANFKISRDNFAALAGNMTAYVTAIAIGV